MLHDIGTTSYQAMQCLYGHVWNYYNQVPSDTTAIQYQGLICPYCSNNNVIVYGHQVDKLLEEAK